MGMALGNGNKQVRVRASWHCLSWTWEELPSASHRSHLCRHLSYQNLATLTWYTFKIGLFFKGENEVTQASASVIYKYVNATLTFSPWKQKLYEELQSLISWVEVYLPSRFCFCLKYVSYKYFCWFFVIFSYIWYHLYVIVLSPFTSSAVEISEAKVWKLWQQRQS